MGTRRIALGLLFAVCISFLIFGSNRAQSRSGAITAALRSREIGELSADRKLYLVELIRQVTRAAGISQQVSINSAYIRGGLHVYTVSPKAARLSFCGLGNAVYDAGLDAIFIDQNLVNPQDFLNLGQETDHSSTISVNELTSQKTYLAFILLHELGHRALHRNLQATFDTTISANKTRELEADHYAITILESVLQHSDGLSLMLAAEKGPFGDAISSATARERAWLTIAQMVDQMSLQLMFSSTPLSSLYRDTSHPSMIDRSESFLEDALAEGACGPVATTYLNLAYRSIERVRALMDAKPLELVLPERIYDVAFTNDGLLVGPEDPTHLYHLSSQFIRKMAAGTPARTLVPASLATIGQGYPTLGPADTKDYSWSAYLSTPDHGVFSIRPWQFWQSTDAFWKKSGDAADPLQGLYLEQHPSAPQPTRRIVLNDGSDVATICDGHPCRSRRLLDVIPHLNPDIEPRFSLNTITEDAIYLTQFDARSGDYRRVVALDADTLSLRKAIELPKQTCGGEMFGGRRRVSMANLIVVPHAARDQILCFFIGVENDHWEAWDVNADPFIQVAAGKFITADVDPVMIDHNRSLRANFVSQAPQLLWAGGSYILLNVDRDSLWLINAVSHRTKVLFHPGGLSTRVVVGHDQLAIFWRSGYKCYLVDIRKEE